MELTVSKGHTNLTLNFKNSLDNWFCSLNTQHSSKKGLGPGADYGLGTIGTCPGPPPAGGPHLTKKKKILMTTVKNKRENDKNGGIVG